MSGDLNEAFVAILETVHTGSPTYMLGAYLVAPATPEFGPFVVEAKTPFYDPGLENRPNVGRPFAPMVRH